MTAWVLRFFSNCRRQSKNRNLEELSTSEIEKAKNTLIFTVQKEYFPENNNIPHIKTFVDNEGLIRVKTRITERKDDFNFLSPILLPNDCILTQRLIEYYHRKNCHAVTQMLVSILREKFWILRARRTVRNIIQNCVKCKRYNAGPVKSESVSLPADRVRDAGVFEVIGIDLAGPLFLKNGGKVWVVLYTCAVYREVHLELIQRIKWKFNPPTAAWWERLIRVLKDILKRTLGNAVLTYEELLTVLCDCESIVNSRPLKYVSEDSEDLIPLTPAMFMMSNASLDVTDLDLSDFARFQKRVGEIVLIENPNKKRLYWPLGKVIELIPGRDGKIRTLNLRCSNSEIIRSIQRVFPLEIQSAEVGESDDVPLDAEALKIPSAGVDVSESAIPVNALPNMPKVSRYGRTIQRPRILNIFSVTTVFESEYTQKEGGCCVSNPRLIKHEQLLNSHWRIPSHVGVPGNEADELAGRGCDLYNSSSSALSHSEIHSFHRAKMNLTWRNPPAHHWYAAKSPDLSIQCTSSRAHQTALARLRSGHLRSMTFVKGVKSLPIPAHLLDCRDSCLEIKTQCVTLLCGEVKNGLDVGFPAPRGLETHNNIF
ncbi:integrase catalytic domain-containing protein [Trichonephila clavipes]|nr:integrase catalytic domain-containing protein [Trichonephila clavipes]